MANGKSCPPAPTRDLLAIAQQLRLVKEAEKQFLIRWADALSRQGASSVSDLKQTINEAVVEPAMDDLLLDALDHDWSNLYRGSVLDD